MYSVQVRAVQTCGDYLVNGTLSLPVDIVAGES